MKVRDNGVSFDSLSTGQVTAALSSQELFRNLGTAVLKDLLAVSKEIRLSSDEILIRQGDPGDSLFLLVDGLLGVEILNQEGAFSQIDEVKPGEMVGEMALLTGQARSATVRALRDSLLVNISRTSVETLADQHPQLITELYRVLVPRLRRTQISEILHHLFDDLDVDTFHHLQSRLQWRQLTSGETVYRQGEPGDGMVILVNGRLKLTRRDADGSEQTAGELSRGSFVGGYVLLTGEPYRETVTAARDSDIVILSQAVFDNFVEDHPDAVLKIARSLARQRDPSSRSLSEQHRRQISFAIVACSPDVPLADFSQRLLEALSMKGSAFYLCSDTFDDLYGKKGASLTKPEHPINTSILSWLSEREAKHRFVLYEADAAWTPWTQRCLRQADRIILVANASTDTALSQVEQAMQDLAERARQELVLLQPLDLEQPKGTRKWLVERRVHRHHHVRMGNASDFERLARMLTGSATALVLSGGGARGIAHIGVYRALLEAGVEIDMLGGTSIGSLIAGCINRYPSPEELEVLAARYFSAKMLHDYTLPVSALLASKKVSRVLQEIFGDTQIEDLWLPYFCVSSNLTRSELVIHRQGSLWQAVRTSTAIPGVFTPISFEGDILVDGAAMNHFPVDIMRAECEGGKIIAVNASPSREGGKAWDFDTNISGWQVLWSKLNPFGMKTKVPSLFSTITRATGVYSKSRLRELVKQADVLVEPDTSPYGVMEWSAYRELIEAGYQAGKATLSAR